jgi:cytochrome P450
MVSQTASIVLSDPAAYVAGVPHEEFARLRRESPLVWMPEVPLRRHGKSGAQAFAGPGFWAVTRHADVITVSRQSDAFSSSLRGAFLSDPISANDLERLRQSLINMDAPEHTRLRQAVTDAFTPATVQTLMASIKAHAEAVVARAVEKGAFDIVQDMAAELPLLVLTDLLGVPREDRSLMFEWSNNLVGFDDPEYGQGNVEQYQRTYVEAFLYVRELADAKRRHPGDDLTSKLAVAEVDGRPLTPEEFSSLWLLLVVGGNESTRHFLSGSLQTLAEWPDERRRLIESPQLTRTAVEELLRWISPIMQFRRTVTRELPLHGRQLKAGDKVILYYIAANRDESVFPSPDRLDLGRVANPHLAFGVGPHFCLGARLARVEAAALFDALRPWLAHLEITGAAVRLESNFMNGIKSLPAVFR